MSDVELKPERGKGADVHVFQATQPVTRKANKRGARILPL